jgi:hypothetical protein
MAIRRPNSGRTTRTTSVPAPVGGWNARDALADMPVDDAVILDNWFPMTSDVRLRDGYVDHSTGITGTVETLMVYNSPTASKLFGAATYSVYDCTLSGAVGAAVVSGLTNARLQYVNVETAGGNFLMAVNGADKLRGYNGSAWWVDGDGTHDITGVDTATCINISVHMHRVWLVQSNTLKIWYLPVNSIAGAATAIDFTSMFKRGGYIMAMGSWTIDSGSGMDDHAAFITSQGEVAIYQGSDPSSSTTWALVGVYQIGAPIGRRCVKKYASDLLIICQDGLMPMSKALLSSRVNNKVSLTDKIQTAISQSVTSYGGNFGWEICLYPQANMLLLNVPVTNGQHQYVMNTITGSWCRFTGWGASCWELFNEQIYFGTSGKVCLAWSTQADAGNNITSEALQAFNKFGTENLKWFKEARPLFQSNTSSLGVSMGLNVDNETIAPPLNTPTYTDNSVSYWGTGKFGTALWGADLISVKDWQTVSALGYSAAMHLQTASKIASVRWSATTYQFEMGSGI